MAKGGDGIWGILLAIAGIIVGAAIVEKLLKRQQPCPNCGYMVQEYAAQCPTCKIPLNWIRHAR